MAFPTAVNSQITDSVTQSSVQVLGDSPAMALGAMYQSVAHATGLAAQNAVAHQQHANQVSIAVTTLCVSYLLGGPKAG